MASTYTPDDAIYLAVIAKMNATYPPGVDGGLAVDYAKGLLDNIETIHAELRKVVPDEQEAIKKVILSYIAAHDAAEV